MRRIIGAVLILTCLAVSVLLPQPNTSEVVRAVDGDTIIIGDGKGSTERVRLIGVDEPLSDLISRKPFRIASALVGHIRD